MPLVLSAEGNGIQAKSLNSYDRAFLNIPEAPNDTIQVRGWAAFACTLVKAKVYSAVVNTVGAYTLTITNNTTGQTVLNAASFDMNTLTADTVTDLTLTSTSADLSFDENDRWTVALTSDNAGFDGSGIYVDLLFEAI
jgi:hypothetical protein